MATRNMKVKTWTPSKGKALMSKIMLREIAEADRDLLLIIHNSNKRWGNDWYYLVKDCWYESAKEHLIGIEEPDALIAVDILDELISLA